MSKRIKSVPSGGMVTVISAGFLLFVLLAILGIVLSGCSQAPKNPDTWGNVEADKAIGPAVGQFLGGSEHDR